jgi:hypothetical protein
MGGVGGRPALGPGCGGAGSCSVQRRLDRGGGAYDAWAQHSTGWRGQTPFELIQIQTVQFNSNISKL